MGCHKLLVFFVCTFVAPKCNATSGMKIPPCRELCYSVRGPCMGQPDVECSQFPLATENPNCISAKMAELPMTPTPIVTTIPIVTTTVTAPWTKKTTSGPVQDQTTPGPTEVSKSSATTVTNHPKMISPSSETSENTVTYRTEGVEPNINEETIPKEKSYESSAGIILGVSVGTLITMVTLVSMCVCCRCWIRRRRVFGVEVPRWESSAKRIKDLKRDLPRSLRTPGLLQRSSLLAQESLAGAVNEKSTELEEGPGGVSQQMSSIHVQT
eukprot:XP_011672619.1 PREDICTED: uncharacterized protein LOC100890953 [Strongylocentrotus purpuratus]